MADRPFPDVCKPLHHHSVVILLVISDNSGSLTPSYHKAVSLTLLKRIHLPPSRSGSISHKTSPCHPGARQGAVLSELVILLSWYRLRCRSLLVRHRTDTIQTISINKPTESLDNAQTNVRWLSVLSTTVSFLFSRQQSRVFLKIEAQTGVLSPSLIPEKSHHFFHQNENQRWPWL